jgi:hypothetical protein
MLRGKYMGIWTDDIFYPNHLETLTGFWSHMIAG